MLANAIASYAAVLSLLSGGGCETLLPIHIASRSLMQKHSDGKSDSHGHATNLIRRERQEAKSSDERISSANAAPSNIGNNSMLKVSEAAVNIDADKISIFCFVWTTRTVPEESLLPEVRKQLSKCNGYAFFTDTEARGPPSPDIIKVQVPSQINAVSSRNRRNSSTWLYHKNMAGLIPAWTYLFDKNIVNQHDWIVNVELDHLVRPSMVRWGIKEHLKSLWNGTPQNRLDVGKSLMLLWGNAYLFNRKMVEEMKSQWARLSKTHPVSSHASGCPNWGDKVWIPYDCSQDEDYVGLAKNMKPPVAFYGAQGCGAFQGGTNGKGQELIPGGLACWQMDNSPAGGDGSEKVQLKTIRAIAAGESHYPDKRIPIIHHIRHASVHALARELQML